jgi:hypothetical protein
VQWLDNANVKCGYATRAVPLERMARMVPMSGAPRIGDLVAGEVLSVGKNTRLEVRREVQLDLFPGDVVVGAFGNRYATDQFEGYVPQGPVEVCDLLSVGGVFGEVASRHASMASPTRLRVLGLVADQEGRPINQRQFGLSSVSYAGSAPEVILVVGSAMNSGKTTTGGTLSRVLSRAGYRVGAAKVTGTAAGRDGRFYESCGARPVLDFTSVGYPSTYMLDQEELLALYRVLLSQLQASGLDYIVLEIADGILQRETRMLLESRTLRDTVDHAFFASSDSFSAEYGVRWLRQYGLPLRAIGGAVTQSPLASQEAEELTGMPCLGVERIMDGTLRETLGSGRMPVLNERDDIFAPGAVARSG